MGREAQTEITPAETKKKVMVIVGGSLPNNGLWKAIRKEVYRIGECYSPRRLMRSTMDGLMVGLKV